MYIYIMRVLVVSKSLYGYVLGAFAGLMVSKLD